MTITSKDSVKSVDNRADFIAKATASRKTTLKSGKGFDADEVHTYLRKRAVNRKATRPKAKSWRT